MTGLSTSVKEKVSSLRDEEVSESYGLRWVMVAYNASGMSKSFPRRAISHLTNFQKQILLVSSRRYSFCSSMSSFPETTRTHGNMSMLSI